MAKYNRDKSEELINSLKSLKLNDFTEKQFTNVGKFLRGISDDTLTAYLLYLVDHSKEANAPKVKEFLKANFIAELRIINETTGEQQ